MTCSHRIAAATIYEICTNGDIVKMCLKLLVAPLRNYENISVHDSKECNVFIN